MLRWTAEALATKAGLGVQTIKRLEQAEGVPSGRAITLMDIRGAFETAGIEFVGTPDDGPGVRLRARASNGQDANG